LYIDYVNHLLKQPTNMTKEIIKSEMDLHSEAIELMRTLNKKYNVSTITSLDEYLDARRDILDDGDVLTIKTLINKF